MPRKTRIIEPGFYHVVSRGVERRNVFLEQEDFEKFFSFLSNMKKEYEIIIHSFCLMTNHYHILLQTSKRNLSFAIKYLNSNYSIYFNKKYKRSGHLWQGRFHSNYLYDDKHFFYICKYIERNPIKANMVKHISHYKYQSFFQWKYKSEYFPIIENSNIFDMTLKEYENYISSEQEEAVLDSIYSSPKILNQNGKVKILYKRLETFFEEETNRNTNIKSAYEYGYSKSEISKLLGFSHTNIIKIINNKNNTKLL